jgi:branched-chain amino acid transport system substrate-binding protein
MKEKFTEELNRLKKGRRDMKKRIWLLVGMVLLTLAILSMPFFGATYAASKTLKIGCTLPLNVGLGLEAKKCLDVIIPDFNARGGLVVGGERYTIDMIIYDDSYKAEKGRAAVERLIYRDKVKHIVGQLGSAPIVAGLAVTEPNRIVVICGGVSRKILAPKNRYTVRTSTVATFGAAFRGYMLKAHPGIKTEVSVGPDDETGRRMAKLDSKICKSYGMKKLKSVFFPRETEDYSGVGLEVARLNPDMVMISGASAGTQTGGLLKGMYEAGYRGVILGTTPDMDAVRSIASVKAIEGFYALFKDATLIPNPSPITAHLKKLYKAKYGSWNETGITWIGAWYAFVEAVKKADSLDQDKIMAAMERLEYDTPQGHCILVRRPDMGVNRYCDTVADVIIGQIKNGKFVYVDTLPAAESLKANETVFGGGSWK